MPVSQDMVAVAYAPATTCIVLALAHRGYGFADGAEWIAYVPGAISTLNAPLASEANVLITLVPSVICTP